jgi:predicted lipoprotein
MSLGGWLLGAVVLLALFPPFHIRSRKAEVPERAQNAVDVPAFAERFWAEKLSAPSVPIAEARPLVAALVQDPALAAEKFGRRAGIGAKTYFLVSGTGHIGSIDQAGAWVDVSGAETPRIVLVTGPVFGNALRDVTGLLNLSNYRSSDFTALSAALDHLSETRAQPMLRELGVGASLSFLAAGELDDASGAVPVFRLAAIRVELLP